MHLLLRHLLPPLLERLPDMSPSMASLSRCAGGEAGQRRTMQLHTLQRGEQLWIAAGVVHKNCSCLLQKRPGCMLQDGEVVAKGSVKGAWSMPEGAEVELAGWELEIEASCMRSASGKATCTVPSTEHPASRSPPSQP